MKDRNIEHLLGELSEKTSELPNRELAEKIKAQVPDPLVKHKGLESVNIIIDLRISKLTAAAAIIVTVLVLSNLFISQYSPGGSFIDDGKIMIDYCFGTNFSETRERQVTFDDEFLYLMQDGLEVVYYGQIAEKSDPNSILLHCKLANGHYRVLFGDMRKETVDAHRLIKLQQRMIQQKAK